MHAAGVERHGGRVESRTRARGGVLRARRDRDRERRAGEHQGARHGFIPGATVVYSVSPTTSASVSPSICFTCGARRMPVTCGFPTMYFFAYARRSAVVRCAMLSTYPM